jgi:hypothetical protein
MSHGEERSNRSTTPFEVINEPGNGGGTTEDVGPTNDSTTREAKEKTFERIEREMDIFRKGECTRFQVSTRVANELDKWDGVSDKEKGKAFDSYLAEINSFIAIQDENRSITRGTPVPVEATLPADPRANGKSIREEVEELLNQISGDELVEGEEVEQRIIRKRAKEEDMPWYSATSNSSRRGSCIKTCRILLQFSEDLSGVKSFLRVANDHPEGIPSSQWDRILRGESVDLNQILS